MQENENELEKLRKEVTCSRDEIARLSQENELLRQKLDALARKIYGKSSEQLDPSQFQLLLEGIEAKKPESDGQDEQEDKPSQTTKPKKERKPRQATLPANIPTEHEILIPEEVQNNPDLYREVGEEITEKLDYTPAQFRLIITIRKKFVKKITTLDDPEIDHFLIAPLPPSLKERSLLTPSLAAEIATNRFCYHLPYYRQQQMFLIRNQVHLPRNTMSQWMGDLTHDYLTGIYDAMHVSLLQQGYLQADETPIDYQQPGNGSVKKGYLWTISRADFTAAQSKNGELSDGRGDIFYQWHSSRGHDCLKELLRKQDQSFIGTLQCDGYRAYETYQQSVEGIELIGCWAHVRRKFYEARAYKAKISIWILNHIQNLYAIEAKLREQRAGPAEREAIRDSQSRPIYRRLEKGLKKLTEKRRILPKSNLGKAMSYALGQWNKLEACFVDGRHEIDNNLIENGIRPTKLGAKNWLFMGSEGAGQSNAIWYTVIESCRRRKIDPYKYLVWVFTELPKLKVGKDTFAQYTPEAYAKKLSSIEKVS